MIDAHAATPPAEVGGCGTRPAPRPRTSSSTPPDYGPQAGRDIAVAGIQVCGGSADDTSFFRGLQVWDVTDPAKPVELGRLNTGCCTRGLHEFEVQHRADLGKTFVYASVPASEYPDADSPSGSAMTRAAATSA